MLKALLVSAALCVASCAFAQDAQLGPEAAAPVAPEAAAPVAPEAAAPVAPVGRTLQCNRVEAIQDVVARHPDDMKYFSIPEGHEAAGFANEADAAVRAFNTVFGTSLKGDGVVGVHFLADHTYAVGILIAGMFACEAHKMSADEFRAFIKLVYTPEA